MAPLFPAAVLPLFISQLSVDTPVTAGAPPRRQLTKTNLFKGAVLAEQL